MLFTSFFPILVILGRGTFDGAATSCLFQSSCDLLRLLVMAILKCSAECNVEVSLAPQLPPLRALQILLPVSGRTCG